MEVLQWIQVARQGVMIEEIRDDVKYLKASRGPPTEDETAFLELVYGTRLDICQEGTRSEVLKRIRGWMDDDSTQEQIFWLKDVAGTGKSTIAATVSHECMDSKRLAGRFFFTPNSKASSGLKDFSVTVARDISNQQSALRTAIDEAIRTISGTVFPIQQQFSRMVIEPLRRLNASVVFVFDALDNCDEDGHRRLIKLLIQYLPSIPKAKVFLTSRPLESIKSLLDDCHMVTGNDIELYAIEDKTLNPDIAVYINNSFHVRHITFEQRMALAMRSNGLFIWAATACRLFQNNRRPGEILDLLLRSKSADNLDGLYLEILKKALIDSRAHQSFMNVLQIVISAIEPVSISTIEILLPENQGVNAFIQDLCSVLKDGDPYRPIHVLHPTFREFLTQGTRANGFLVQPSTSHSLLARACLSCLLRGLRYNIIGSRGMTQGDPPMFNDAKARSELESNISRPMLQAMLYAAKYWTHHLLLSVYDQELAGLFGQFLKEKLLNWMELLSICEVVPFGIESISSLVASSKSVVGVMDHLLVRCSNPRRM